MAEEEPRLKIKVADPEGGVVLVNLHQHDTLGSVVHVADLRLIFPDAIGLSYSVGEISSVCSISDDGKAITAPMEGWTSPVYTVINPKKKTGFEAKKKYSFHEWKQHAAGSSSSKPKEMQPEKCEITVGVMLLRKNDLCKIRRNSSLGFGTVSVKVNPNASADEVLQKAVRLHLRTHEDMEDTEYTLLYSDKTRVNTVPGKPKIKFSPALYVKNSTVNRIRDIRLYIASVSDYEAYYRIRKGIDLVESSGDAGSTKQFKKTKPKGIIKKEVSFTPHSGAHVGSGDDLEETLEEVDTTKVDLLKDKYGTIDITYRGESQSSYGGNNAVMLCTDRQEAVDSALNYEPSQADIHVVNPIQMGLTVDEISKGENTYLCRAEDGNSFNFPSSGDQLPDGVILHGPDVISGCDGYGVMCGVITKCHGNTDALHEWHKNGEPFASGNCLSVIPVNEDGEYRCSVSLGDAVDISKPFLFKDIKQTKKKNTKNEKPKQKSVTFQDKEQEQEKVKQVGAETTKTVKRKHNIVMLQGDEEERRVEKKRPTQQKAQAHMTESEKYQFRTIGEDEIKFKKSDEIGRGSFGVVYKGEWIGTPVAVKVISTRQLLQKPKKLIQEAQIHVTLNHPNILQLMGACIQKKHLMILTPYIHGLNLDKLIFPDEQSDSTGKMETDMKAYIAWQAATSVAYLHHLKPPIIHQDIKPANFILENQTNVVRLMDLGLAKLKNAVSTSQGGTTVNCGGGTPLYSAPEIIVDGEPAAEPADVWGLGCTILELFTEEPVWDNSEGGEEGDDEDNFLLALMQKKMLPKGIKKLEDRFALVSQCFIYNKSERTSSISIVEGLKSTFDSEKYAGYKI